MPCTKCHKEKLRASQSHGPHHKAVQCDESPSPSQLNVLQESLKEMERRELAWLVAIIKADEKQTELHFDMSQAKGEAIGTGEEGEYSALMDSLKKDLKRTAEDLLQNQETIRELTKALTEAADVLPHRSDSPYQQDTTLITIAAIKGPPGADCKCSGGRSVPSGHCDQRNGRGRGNARGRML